MIVLRICMLPLLRAMLPLLYRINTFLVEGQLRGDPIREFEEVARGLEVS